MQTALVRVKNANHVLQPTCWVPGSWGEFCREGVGRAASPTMSPPNASLSSRPSLSQVRTGRLGHHPAAQGRGGLGPRSLTRAHLCFVIMRKRRLLDTDTQERRLRWLCSRLTATVTAAVQSLWPTRRPQQGTLKQEGVQGGRGGAEVTWALVLDLTESPRHLGQGGVLSAPLWGGPPGRGRGRGGLGPGTGEGGAHGCLLGSGHSPPREGEGLAHLPSCGCNWFSSLSLPPSLPACFSLLFLSLSYPLRIPSRTHPISVACGSWGHPTLLPCLLAWSCLLSRCLPQEVGTRRPRSPSLQERGLGAQTPGPGLASRLRERKAHPGGTSSWGPSTPVPACLSVCPTRCFVPGPDSPRPCACSASHPLPLPEALTLC